MVRTGHFWSSSRLLVNMNIFVFSYSSYDTLVIFIPILLLLLYSSRECFYSYSSLLITWFPMFSQGGRINLDAQIDNFANNRQEIISNLGISNAINLLRNALYSFTIGSNDFINNYLTPVLSVPERAVVSPEAFVESMISKFRQQLTVINTSSPLFISLWIITSEYDNCSSICKGLLNVGRKSSIRIYKFSKSEFQCIRKMQFLTQTTLFIFRKLFKKLASWILYMYNKLWLFYLHIL